MGQMIEAIIDDSGNVKVLNDLRLPRSRRAIVTVLEDDSRQAVSETAFLSEDALATDWLRDDEDEAWSHLQSEQ